jgi:hypothetical protein
MVLHWRSLRTSGWKVSAVINGVGAVVTAVVLVIVAITKAVEGAWIIILMIPTLVLLFEVTRRHYDHVATALTLRNWTPGAVGANTVVVPVGGLQRAVVTALQYARSLSNDVRAVYVAIDPAATAAMREQWPSWGQGAELVVLESPYRSLLEPLLAYIDAAQRANPTRFVTVVLPEFVPRRMWQHLLHNQHALLIKSALFFRPNVVLISVPFHLGEASAPRVSPSVGS